ncbi:TonB-dependent receptor [Limibacter armeniacum]|uniref:TonB-dependent receptor n=1 Tax=Limibacter armeniacum TaxID=466084 RepID=UPI002FE543A4
MRAVLFSMLLMLPVLSFGQYSISGKVTQASNQEALFGATVSIEELNKGIITDASGAYKISGLPEGNYTLSVSFLGFVPFSQPITLKQDVILDIPLKEDFKELGTAIIYAKKDYPVTVTELTAEEIAPQNLGQDLPVLLNFQPSIVTTSDAGAGIGYTGMRIRGSDPTRINVTINGIPLNDAESQGVFWVNMPDFASSVDNIAIQRGVGTSVNGAGAFGASVNLTTEAPADKPYAQVGTTVGSFGTWKVNTEFSTGKLNDHFSLYGRLSKTESDGYIDNAWVDLKSFYLSGKYESKAGNFTANVFSGKEVTFQAWNGVSEQKIAEGDRTFNELAGYDNEVDNYQQDHLQFLYDKQIGSQWFLNAALHYTKGRGYFEQYKADQSLTEYGLETLVIGDTTISNTDLIRRRWLDNDFYGGIFSINYQSPEMLKGAPVLDVTVGGGWNRYEGQHFGEVIWAQYMSNGNIRHRYYDNNATKKDFNIYAKANYQVVENLFVFGDLQLRKVQYNFLGPTQTTNPETGQPVFTELPQQTDLSFFNPKTGITYKLGKSTIYSSFGIGHKEPNRDDFTGAVEQNWPEAEELRNLEVGYSFAGSKLAFAANYYLMDYDNQLISTGKINDVGAYIRENVKDSYRMGIELQGKWNITDQVSWDANMTLSQNKIKEFTEFLDNYDSGEQQAITYKDTDIAFSPNLIAGSQLAYRPTNGLKVALLTKYVGEQYLDNTQTDSRKIEAYLTNDIRLNYTFSAGVFKEIGISALFNNIFDELYESNGYTYGYIWGGETVRQNYYYPQAGRNFLIAVRFKI